MKATDVRLSVTDLGDSQNSWQNGSELCLLTVVGRSSDVSVAVSAVRQKVQQHHETWDHRDVYIAQKYDAFSPAFRAKVSHDLESVEVRFRRVEDEYDVVSVSGPPPAVQEVICRFIRESGAAESAQMVGLTEAAENEESESADEGDQDSIVEEETGSVYPMT